MFRSLPPLLLFLDTSNGAKRRFRFESFQTKMPGFIDVIATTWSTSIVDADPFWVINYKLRKVAKALQSWNATKVGSVRLQLAMTREVLLCLEEAQESRLLTPREHELRRSLKIRTPGLSSLARTIVRQRSRLIFLADGDANTCFYHLQACHRRRKNTIVSLNVNGSEVVDDELLAQAVYEHFNSIWAPILNDRAESICRLLGCLQPNWKPWKPCSLKMRFELWSWACRTRNRLGLTVSQGCFTSFPGI